MEVSGGGGGESSGFKWRQKRGRWFQEWLAEQRVAGLLRNPAGRVQPGRKRRTSTEIDGYVVEDQYDDPPRLRFDPIHGMTAGRLTKCPHLDCPPHFHFDNWAKTAEGASVMPKPLP